MAVSTMLPLKLLIISNQYIARFLIRIILNKIVEKKYLFRLFSSDKRCYLY